MTHLEDLQQAMKKRGIDALLLGGDGAGHFAGGHRRIGVHIAGSPIPNTIVPADGPPHVVTADPDGALGLPADHVHGMMWNPAVLVDKLPAWLGASSGLTIGVDSLSPGGRTLIEAAIPDCVLVDAGGLLAEMMLPKTPEELAIMRGLCELATRAAEAAVADGRTELYRVLDGAFPVAYPTVGEGRAAVAIRGRGFIGEARIGPGDAAVGGAALKVVGPGRAVSDIAAELPAGVEVVGLGRTYEPPLLRAGDATPPDLCLVPGAVLAVRWDACGVTVAVGADGNELLSKSPEEVAR